MWNAKRRCCILFAKNSPEAEVWRKAIFYEAKRAHVPRLMDGPIQIKIVYYLPRAQKTSVELLFRDKTPDIDKLDRLVLDSLTDVAWRDDCQVCDSHSIKRYLPDGGRTGAQITIAPLAPTIAGLFS